MGGCICIENKTSNASTDTIFITLTTNSPCASSATYNGQGYTALAGGNSGGGAIFNTSQGICSSCAPCCNNLMITATISVNGAPQGIPLTLTGGCGDTLSAQMAGEVGQFWGGNTLNLSLDTFQECCGSCTTCHIKCGKLTIT